MSHYVNESDVLNQMKSFGLMPDLPLEVGSTKKAIRCKTEDNQREKRGWYSLFSISIGNEPHIVGSYGIWCGDNNSKQKIELAKKQRDTLTPDQRKAIQNRQREIQKQAEAVRKAEADRAAEKAKAAWSKLPDTGTSPYLSAKQVDAHGIRFTRDHSIVIPLRDDTDAIRGLQFIYPPGHKQINIIGGNKQVWPAGLSMSGTWHLIGGIPRDILLITEGYATGASLHQATGYPVAVCWNANNLLSAAQALHKKYRGARILVCGDDDWLQKCKACGQYTTVISAECTHCSQPHGKNNAGRSCAETAAIAVNGAWLLPEFREQRPGDRKGPTDFNDLHCLEGLRQVRAQIGEKVSELGWLKPVPAPSPTEGGGGKRTALKSMLHIDEAIERFSMVYGGKGTMFDHQEHCLVPKADVLDILPEHGWRDMRAHKKVVRLDEVGFDPGGTDPRILCNLYGGWPTEPQAGSCDQLLELLRYLCSNEEHPEEVYQWVLKWLAYPIQNPGAKMRTSLILHGGQGTGKNLFFESVMAIYGEYGRMVDQSAIEDKFNDWASRKLFLIADEVVARTELFHVKNKLKGLVTGEWIRINPKNVAAHDERNHVNLVFLSNESIPLVLESDDRRYMVIHTPEKLAADFYSAVSSEIKSGGIPALHHYLTTVDLAGFDMHSKPPATKAKTQLIEASLDSVGSFVRDWMQGEVMGMPFCPCSTAQLYILYRRYCDRTGERYPRIQRQFVGDIRMMPGWRVGPVTTRQVMTEERISRKMAIPPDSLMEGRDHARKSHMNQENWLHECHQAFTLAGEFSE